MDITVSLGVGGNPAKRDDGDFERELLQMLAETGATLLVDKGGSEGGVVWKPRCRRALARADGAFGAPFAAQIARSRLFVYVPRAGT